MLRSRGFARQDPKTHAYYAGPALLGLAQSLLEEGALCRAAQLELETLATRSRETVVLAVLRGSEAHVLSLIHICPFSDSQHRSRSLSGRLPG